MNVSGGRWIQGAIVVTVVVGAVVLATGLTVGTFSPAASLGGDPSPDGEGVAHVSPENASTNGNLTAVQRRFAERIAARINANSELLADANASNYSSLVGDEYRDVIAEYADSTGDEAGAETVRNATRFQQRFATAVADYRRLYDRYENATRFGVDGPGVLKLARRLEANATRVNRTAEALLANYDRIANDSTVNLTRSREVVRDVRANVAARQRSVREEAFRPTRLSAEAGPESFSFADPATVSGRVTTAAVTSTTILSGPEGTRPVELTVSVPSEGIGNATVLARVGGRTVRTRTNATGHYSLTVTPGFVPAGPTTVALEYRPEDTTYYRRAERSLNRTIRPTTPTVDVATSTESAVYADLVAIRGNVTAGGYGVGNVPVEVTVDGQSLGTVETGPNGTYVVEAPVPANVSTGSVTVRAAVETDGFSVANGSATTALNVGQAPTDLSVSVGTLSGKTVTVSGRLQSESGAPVPGQRLAILVDGTAVGSATTGPGGRYETQVVVPESVVSGGFTEDQAIVSVEVRYDGRGTNLGGTSGSDTTFVSLSFPWLLVGVSGLTLGAVVVLTIRVGLGSVFDRGEDEPPEDDVPDADAADTGSGFDAGVLVATAREELSAGNRSLAVQLSYAAASTALEREFGGTSSLTPWELCEFCERSGVDPERGAALRRLTQVYESATFADVDVGVEDAESAIEAAESVTAGRS